MQWQGDWKMRGLPVAEQVAGGYQLNVDSGDRFGFGFFIAMAVHLILIFGVVFNWVDSSQTQSDLEVTLVTHYSSEAPDEADFLAQQNQQASGTEEDPLVPTSPSPESRANMDGEQGNMPQSPVQIQGGEAQNRVLTTRTSSETTVGSSDLEAPQPEAPTMASASARQSLLARLDMLQQEYARRPRIGTLTSVAAKAREDAEYQAHMQQRVSEIGNRNYPRESIERGVFGSLRMKLTVLPDGTLESTEITESSGYPVLDRSAVRIARLSAPFEPFSRNLETKYDKIVFIRTWQFLPGGRLTAEP
jgi:protein TonB